MISQKMQSLVTLLGLASEGRVLPDSAVFKVAHRVAEDLLVQVKALEDAQIAKRQKLTEDDLASGKIVQLPIIAKKQALLQ